DVIGTIEQGEPLRADAEADDVAVLARQLRQHPQSIAAQRRVEVESVERAGRPRERHGRDLTSAAGAGAGAFATPDSRLQPQAVGERLPPPPGRVRGPR